MKRHIIVAVCAVALLSIACEKKADEKPADKAPTAEAKKPEVKPEAKPMAKAEAKKDDSHPNPVTVEQVSTWLNDGKVTAVDANNEKTRKEYGKIPGAIVLSGYEFDVKELPDDKDSNLVFYCSNTACGAAGSAAKKAMMAGYNKVQTLPVGIKGWKEAGQKTEEI